MIKCSGLGMLGMLGMLGILRTPFSEGCAGANKKASPPGRQQRCTFSPTTFSSVQFSLTFLGVSVYLGLTFQL